MCINCFNKVGSGNELLSLVYICQICYLLVDKDDLYYNVDFIDSKFVAVAGGLCFLWCSIDLHSGTIKPCKIVC